MLAILFVVVGIGLGIWQGISRHKTRPTYGPTGTGIALTYILLSFAAAAVTYVAVLLLPANSFDTMKYNLVSIEDLANTDKPVYVGSNYNSEGRRTLSFIADMNGQTVLRNDLVFRPANIIEHGPGDTATVTYQYPFNNYPLLFPGRFQVGGTYSTVVQLDVPRGSVVESFHVPPIDQD